MAAVLGCSALAFVGCGGTASDSATGGYGSDNEALQALLASRNASSGSSDSSDSGTVYGEKFDISSVITATDLVVTYSAGSAVAITFDGESVSTNHSVVAVSGNTATISMSGTYILSGTLTDGQLIIDADDAEVQLIFDNVSMTCSDSAPIYIIDAAKVIITLPEGTESTLTDAAEYVYDTEEDDEPNACLFSKDDLVINGTGTLNVVGNYNDGINAKDGLIIVDCTLNVTSADHGIRANDYIEIDGATITVNAGGDGIKAANTTTDGYGYIYISDGTFMIAADGDGMEAATCMLIAGGTFDITTGSGAGESASTSSEFGGMGYSASSSSSTTGSMKGLKASCDITVTGGDFVIDAEDDAIHTNSSVNIEGGSFEIASGDDGIHADSELTIAAGYINITQSYEGLEAGTINIDGGETHVVASDDGLNASDGSTSTYSMGMSSGSGTLNITGGELYVNSGGDGLDSNGDINMSDGLVIVSGPTSSADGAIDFGDNGSFSMTGGILLAAGASGMAEGITSSSSTVNCFEVTFSGTMEAGTLINVSTEDGETVWSFAPESSYQSVIIAGEALETGVTYVISYGGTCDGEETEGYYADAAYSGGTEFQTVTISSVVTAVNESGTSEGSNGFTGGGMGGMGGMRR